MPPSHHHPGSAAPIPQHPVPNLEAQRRMQACANRGTFHWTIVGILSTFRSKLAVSADCAPSLPSHLAGEQMYCWRRQAGHLNQKSDRILGVLIFNLQSSLVHFLASNHAARCSLFFDIFIPAKSRNTFHHRKNVRGFSFILLGLVRTSVNSLSATGVIDRSPNRKAG